MLSWFPIVLLLREGYVKSPVSYAFIGAAIGGALFAFVAFLGRGHIADAPPGIFIAGTLLDFSQGALFCLLAFWVGRIWSRVVVWWKKAGSAALVFGFMLSNGLMLGPVHSVGEEVAMWLVVWALASATIFVALALGFGIVALFRKRETS